jgi:hypothetical protein
MRRRQQRSAAQRSGPSPCAAALHPQSAQRGRLALWIQHREGVGGGARHSLKPLGF